MDNGYKNIFSWRFCVPEQVEQSVLRDKNFLHRQRHDANKYKILFRWEH